MKKDFSKAFRAVWLLLVIVISLGAMAQTPQEWKSLKRTVNFFVANDLGRNGYYDQRIIADCHAGNLAVVNHFKQLGILNALAVGAGHGAVDQHGHEQEHADHHDVAHKSPVRFFQSRILLREIISALRKA